jgi:hypothetical protein
VSIVTTEPDASIARDAASGWLIGPWFDALFIANVAWPLLFLAQIGESHTGESGVPFWQLYFITTPHRWITLAIVFLDGDRFQQRRGTFVALAFIAIAACLAVRLSTGALTCLMAIDYVWNAWHFAAQHHGVYRVYCRNDEAISPFALNVEKWTMRLFVLYVALRTASATWSDGVWHDRSQVGDVAASVVPAGLTIWVLVRARAASLGRMIYALSMITLYSSLLFAIHVHRFDLVLPLATASALFHAIEYLALVTWSVQQRHAAKGERIGLLAYFIPRWGIALAIFMLILGIGGWFLNHWFLDAWLFLNVIVAFLHYAYDGLIWRRAE